MVQMGQMGQMGQMVQTVQTVQVATTGSNEWNQCGDQEVEEETVEEVSTVPKVYHLRRVVCLSNECVVSVSAGSAHSLAVTKNGRLFSWGCGQNGRLGHGDETTTKMIREVLGLNHKAHCIAAGSTHSISCQ